MYKKFGQNIQRMRDQGRRPPIGTKSRHNGRRKSAKVERMDAQAQTSQLQQWATYVRNCCASNKEPLGVPLKIMDELERLQLI
jgi:hypothetical protein